jgi:hypothetical protein
MRQGAVDDLGEDDLPEVIGPDKLLWVRNRIPRVMHGSDAVLSASRPLQKGITQASGLYFLIWSDRICYVGQARNIFDRVRLHAEEGRPIHRVATVCGLPKWGQTEFEYAYIRAWNLPWNNESTRSGRLEELPDLQEFACKLNNEFVMPWYTPTFESPPPAWPQWKCHVHGILQAKDRGEVPWLIW